MYKLGLTGSIGMGKSTTASLFAKEGCAIWDADAAVHRLYSKGGAAVAEFAEYFPASVVDGAVSRTVLKTLIAKNHDVLAQIEQIVHPLVLKDRLKFSHASQADIAVFDIPLLFEKQSESEFDGVACVFVDLATQKARVMERGTMTESQFDLILSKQMPIEEKLKKADFRIETKTLDQAKKQVQAIIATIKEETLNA